MAGDLFTHDTAFFGSLRRDWNKIRNIKNCLLLTIETAAVCFLIVKRLLRLSP